MNKIQAIFTWACIIFACLFTAAFFAIAILSINYPFHLEWMEGQSIDIIRRIRDGLPFYVAPSIDYVPYIYTPLYFYAATLISFLTGVEFFPARLLSILSALGCGAIIYKWIRKEGGEPQHGVIAAGLFFGTYNLSGRWFDVARVDSFCLLLTLAGLYVFYHHRGWKHAVAAAALLTAAFFAKQSALMVSLPMVAAMLFADRTHALRTGAVLAVLLLAGISSYNYLSDGWFSFYVFEVPASHGPDNRHILDYWTRDLLKPLAVALGLSAAVVAWLCQHDRGKAVLYGGLFLGMALGCYVARVHYASNLNVLMPVHAALALMAGLALRRFGWIAVALMALQFVTLVYNPVKLIPAQADVEKGNFFLAEIANIPGDIFMPEMHWVQTRVGKKSYPLGMAAYDLFRARLGEKNHIRNAFRREVADAVRMGRFDAIMPGGIFRLPEKRDTYVFYRNIPYPREFVTGVRYRVRTDIFIRANEVTP